MHDIVIGLVINILEFGLRVARLFNGCRVWPSFFYIKSQIYIDICKTLV